MVESFQHDEVVTPVHDPNMAVIALPHLHFFMRNRKTKGAKTPRREAVPWRQMWGPVCHWLHDGEKNAPNMQHMLIQRYEEVGVGLGSGQLWPRYLCTRKPFRSRHIFQQHTLIIFIALDNLTFVVQVQSRTRREQMKVLGSTHVISLLFNAYTPLVYTSARMDAMHLWCKTWMCTRCT